MMNGDATGAKGNAPTIHHSSFLGPLPDLQMCELSSDLCNPWKSVAKNPPATAGGTDKSGDRVPLPDLLIDVVEF